MTRRCCYFDPNPGSGLEPQLLLATVPHPLHSFFPPPPPVLPVTSFPISLPHTLCTPPPLIAYHYSGGDKLQTCICFLWPQSGPTAAVEAVTPAGPKWQGEEKGRKGSPRLWGTGTKGRKWCGGTGTRGQSVRLWGGKGQGSSFLPHHLTISYLPIAFPTICPASGLLQCLPLEHLPQCLLLYPSPPRITWFPATAFLTTVVKDYVAGMGAENLNYEILHMDNCN